MIPAPIKRFFLSQASGVTLCLIALFLIGNTLYLNSVRDRKAEMVDTIGQALDDYQLQLGHMRKAGLPEALNRDLQYGSLLRAALGIFKTAGKDITISKIKLTEDEKAVQKADNGSQTFPSSHLKKKKEPERVQTLQILGAVSPSQNPESYSQLNEVMAQIKTETGCQFSLERAGETMDSEQKAQGNQPLNFEIRLVPMEQKACVRKFTRSGGNP